jgi:hypothetical protein
MTYPHKMPTPQTGLDLACHIELEHERELGGFTGNVRELRAMHREMHARLDHWSHSHGR